MKEFKGAVGERHLIRFGSADLLAEDSGKFPWKDGVVHTDTLNIMTAAILESTGTTDTAVVFDGGSTKVRREVERQFDAANCKTNRQVSIVFEQPKTPEGRAWQRVFGANTLETGCIATKFKSRKWLVQKRDKFTHGVDCSSAGNVFPSVPVRSMTSLPTMTAKDRATMTFQQDMPQPRRGALRRCSTRSSLQLDRAKTVGLVSSLSGRALCCTGGGFLARLWGDGPSMPQRRDSIRWYLPHR